MTTVIARGGSGLPAGGSVPWVVLAAALVCFAVCAVLTVRRRRK